MYEKPLIHRGDTLGARAGSCTPAGCSTLWLFREYYFLSDGVSAVWLRVTGC